jgi:hypothetical protein
MDEKDVSPRRAGSGVVGVISGAWIPAESRRKIPRDPGPNGACRRPSPVRKPVAPGAVRGLESSSDRGVHHRHVALVRPGGRGRGDDRSRLANSRGPSGRMRTGDAHGLLRFGLRLPVAWRNTYGRRRHVDPWSQEFPLPDHPASGDPDRHSSRMRLRRQNSWLLPGSGAALALRPRLAGYGSVPSSRP